MKKLMMTITMAVLSSTALADEMFRNQQPNTGLERVKFDAYCGNGEKVAKVLEHYGERSFIGFKSQRILNKETLAFEAILFANPKDSSWTWVEKIEEDTYCIIATGNRMVPHGRK